MDEDMNNALMMYFYDGYMTNLQTLYRPGMKKKNCVNNETCKNKINRNLDQQIENKGVDNKICKYFENYKL